MERKRTLSRSESFARRDREEGLRGDRGLWGFGASSDVSSVPRQAGKQQRQGLGVISQALSNPRPTTARITACWISPTQKGTTPLGKLHRL